MADAAQALSSTTTAVGEPRERAGSLAAGAPLAIAALAAVVVRATTGPHPVDDAFITFRYARNLAEGFGLVYNPGEAVLGTTTPAWALLLAGAYRLGFTDLPAAALALSCIADATTAVLLGILASRAGLGSAGGLVGLAWALNPMSVAYAVGGMETSLFVLSVVAALALCVRGHPFGAALGGLSILVRPEGALVAIVVVGYTLRRAGRRSALRAAAIAGIPAVVYAVLLALVYGSPVPQTVLAKQVAYLQQAPWTSALVLLLQMGLPGWSPFFPTVLPPEMSVAFSLALALVGAATLLVLAARGLRHASAAGLDWQPFAAFLVLYVAFHVVGGLRGGRLFPWYLVPTVPFYILATSRGLATILPGRMGWVAAAALVAWQVPAIALDRPYLPAGFDLRREALYSKVGAELARTYRPDALLAAPEIGALGYTSRLRVLDTVGLVSPSASRYYPLPPDQVEGDQAIPSRLITDTLPDLVVTLDQFARRSLLVDPEFQRRYRLRGSEPASIWLSRELLVFERVDPPVGAERRW